MEFTLGWFPLLQKQGRMCRSSWDTVPFIEGVTLQLCDAGVKWKSEGCMSPLLSSVPFNAHFHVSPISSSKIGLVRKVNCSPKAFRFTQKRW